MPTKPPSARRKQQLLVRTAINRLTDQRRGSSSSRGYDARWAREAKRHLRSSPLCRYCQTSRSPRLMPAVLVDHFYPHRGDMDLFWDPTWWVSSCAHCHNSFKQRVEHAGLDALDRLAVRLGLPIRPRD